MERVIAEADRALKMLDQLPDERNVAFPYRNVAVVYRAHGDSLAEARDTAGASRWYQGALAALQRSEAIERKLDEQYRAINGSRGVVRSTYLPAAVYREIGITYLKLNRPAYAIDASSSGTLWRPTPTCWRTSPLPRHDRRRQEKKGVIAAIEALEVDAKRTYLADKILQTYKLIDPSGCPGPEGRFRRKPEYCVPARARGHLHGLTQRPAHLFTAQPDRCGRVHPPRRHPGPRVRRLRSN